MNRERRVFTEIDAETWRPFIGVAPSFVHVPPGCIGVESSINENPCGGVTLSFVAVAPALGKHMAQSFIDLVSLSDGMNVEGPAATQLFTVRDIRNAYPTDLDATFNDGDFHE